MSSPAAVSDIAESVLGDFYPSDTEEIILPAAAALVAQGKEPELEQQPLEQEPQEKQESSRKRRNFRRLQEYKEGKRRRVESGGKQSPARDPKAIFVPRGVQGALTSFYTPLEVVPKPVAGPRGYINPVLLALPSHLQERVSIPVAADSTNSAESAPQAAGNRHQAPFPFQRAAREREGQNRGGHSRSGRVLDTIQRVLDLPDNHITKRLLGLVIQDRVLTAESAARVSGLERGYKPFCKGRQSVTQHNKK